MKFHNHETLFEYNRRIGNRYSHWKSFYDINIPAACDKAASGNQSDCTTANMYLMDREWYEETRPYYKVWPSIIEPLKKVKLDLNLAEISADSICVCIRFADGHEITNGEFKIRSVLMRYSNAMYGMISGSKTSENKILCVWPFIQDGTGRIRDSIVMPISSEFFGNSTIEQMLDHVLFFSKDMSIIKDFEKAATMAVRISLGVLLLSSDPEIITPDVLSADQEKFSQTGDVKYIEKAKRRGVVGWNIGKEFETCPHYRRPHLALRHTGKGRNIPRIVPIKGTIVHRNKLTEVPTGYILPNGQEIEPHSGERA